MHERIRLLRKTLGLTQSQFASRIGSKQSTVATYEGGRNEPIESVILSICREFDVNEDWLRNGGNDEDMFNKHSDHDAELAEKIGEMLTIKDPNVKKIMIKWIMTLSCDELDMCLKLAKKLVDSFYMTDDES